MKPWHYFVISIALILISGWLLGCGVGKIVDALAPNCEEQLCCPITKVSLAISLGIIARICYMTYKGKLREEEIDKLTKQNTK